VLNLKIPTIKFRKEKMKNMNRRSPAGMIFLALLVQLVPCMAHAAGTEEEGMSMAGGPPSAKELSTFARTYTFPPENAVVVPGVPNYFWSYGCGPTSAAMLLAYYARGEYPAIFDVVPPMDNSEYGHTDNGEYVTGEIPFAVSTAHLRDYWREFLSNADPYRRNWEKHAPDCLADHMGSSDMASCGNLDGGTWVFYSAKGGKHVSTRTYDGIRGISRYVASRGYVAEEYYTQSIGENGYTIEEYRAEIDAGRPVLVHTMTHMMLGVGYVPEENKIVVHNNFTKWPTVMGWGEDYLWCGEHWACSVVRLAPPGTPPPTDGKIVVYDRMTKYINAQKEKMTETAKVLLQTRGQSVERTVEVRHNRLLKTYEVAETESRYDFNDETMSGTAYSPGAEMRLMFHGELWTIDFETDGQVKLPPVMNGSGYGYTDTRSFAQVIRSTQKIDKKTTAESLGKGMDLDEATALVTSLLEARGYRRKN
jgi:hypothetical protein